MPLMNYPGEYADANGTEPIVISNDGKTLRVTIRGVEFTGRMFDDFEPVGDVDRARASGFVLHHDELRAYTLRCVIPVRVVLMGDDVHATLLVQLELGAPNADDRIDVEQLRLSLKFGAHELHSQGTSGWFEDELLDLNQQLPDKGFIRTCISCAFSDYSPYGHGLFGCMMCFRGAKEAYRKVDSKQALFDIWGQATEDVQETHCCEDFERRTPGSGYRG